MDQPKFKKTLACRPKTALQPQSCCSGHLSSGLAKHLHFHGSMIWPIFTIWFQVRSTDVGAHTVSTCKTLKLLKFQNVGFCSHSVWEQMPSWTFLCSEAVQKSTQMYWPESPVWTPLPKIRQKTTQKSTILSKHVHCSYAMPMNFPLKNPLKLSLKRMPHGVFILLSEQSFPQRFSVPKVFNNKNFWTWNQC